MPVTVDFDAAGLIRALRRPGGVEEQIAQTLAERVAELARRYAPGTMASMISVEKDSSTQGIAYLVVSNHPASTYVVNGTRPHIIRPRRAKALRFEVGGQVVFAKVVHHPGTQPNDFLGRALTEVIR